MMADERPVACEGLRVHVFDVDKTELGYGTITKVEELVWPSGEKISDNYPSRIELDNGKVYEGSTCWWFPLNESDCEWEVR